MMKMEAEAGVRAWALPPRPLPLIYNSEGSWGSGIVCAQDPTSPHYAGMFPVHLNYIKKRNRPPLCRNQSPGRGPRARRGGAQPAVASHRECGLAGPRPPLFTTWRPVWLRYA